MFMNGRKLMKTVALIVSVGLFYACNEPDIIAPGTDTGIDGPGDVTQGELRGTDFSTTELRTKLRSLGIGGPMSEFFASSSPGEGPFSSSRISGNSSARTAADVCYTETYTAYDDGSYDWSVDFGDGCGLEGENISGKMFGSGSYDESSFSETITYENFGDGEYLINGTESNSGTWILDSTYLDEEWEDGEAFDGEIEIEDEYYWGVISSSYEFEQDFQVVYTEDSMTFEATWVSNGRESSDENGWTVDELYELVEASTGERFESQVTSPLFMDFNCFESWVYVSGVEMSTWTEGTFSGEEIIDYGDGTCDNLAIITTDGVSEEVDLSEEWDWDEEWDDEEDEDDND